MGGGWWLGIEIFKTKMKLECAAAHGNRYVLLGHNESMPSMN